MKTIKMAISILALSILPLLGMDNGKRPASEGAAPEAKRQNTAAAPASLLREAAAQGNLEKFSQALAAGAHPLLHCPYELPVIDLAIYKKIAAQKTAPDAERDARYDEIIQRLLEGGARPNPIVAHDKEELLLSHVGQHHANTRLLRLLLNHDIDPNLIVKRNPFYGICALLSVMDSDSPTNPCYENMKALLEYGANPNPQNNENYIILNSLTCAAKKGNENAVNLLLAYGADLMTNLGTPTAIEIAIANNQIGILRKLLESGTPVESAFYRIQPLAFAALTQKWEATQLLLAYGASPNIVLDANRNLFIAVLEKQREEALIAKKSEGSVLKVVMPTVKIAVELLFHGAKFNNNQNNLLYETAILRKLTDPAILAAAYGTPAQLAECLEKNKQKAKNVATIINLALKWAVSKTNRDTITYLLEHGAQPQEAFGIVTSFLIRENNIGPSPYTAIFKQLANAVGQSEESRALLGICMARTGLRNLELVRLFLAYNADVMPSLHYLDKVLLRPLQPAERARLNNIMRLLVTRAPLHEQIIRKSAPISDLLMANVRRIPAPELRERIIAQLRRESLMARRVSGG